MAVSAALNSSAPLPTIIMGCSSHGGVAERARSCSRERGPTRDPHTKRVRFGINIFILNFHGLRNVPRFSWLPHCYFFPRCWLLQVVAHLLLRCYVADLFNSFKAKCKRINI